MCKMPDSNEDGFASQANTVSVKLPPFWPKQPDMWFHTVEATFSLRRITEDQTKFEYVLTTLDGSIQERVADFFDNLPPPGTRYQAFKTRLLDSFTTNRYQRMASLVSLALGDDNPSQLLDRMLGLYRPDANAGDNPLFRYHFLQKLPVYIRDQVAAREDLSLRDLSKLADKVYAQRQSAEACALEVSGEVDSVRRFWQDKSRRTPGTSAQDRKLCWAHTKFGDLARSCRPPCAWAHKTSSAPGNASTDRR